jgi:hypothetical protein
MSYNWYRYEWHCLKRMAPESQRISRMHSHAERGNEVVWRKSVPFGADTLVPAGLGTWI